MTDISFLILLLLGLVCYLVYQLSKLIPLLTSIMKQHSKALKDLDQKLSDSFEKIKVSQVLDKKTSETLNQMNQVNNALFLLAQKIPSLKREDIIEQDRQFLEDTAHRIMDKRFKKTLEELKEYIKHKGY
jgi:predicted PurR-regulated permease PerM